MYKLVMYGLLFISACAILLGFAGKLYYEGWQLLASWVILVWACYAINMAFAWALKAPATGESSAITGMILFLIMQPATNWTDAGVLVLIAAVAMASKYLLAWRGRHLFNPAAFAAVVFGFTPWAAVWWVANPWLFVPVAIVGLLIVRKIRRVPLLASYLAGFSIAYLWVTGLADPVTVVWQGLASWPIIFFASVMLPEPSTVVPGRRWRIATGFAIGLFMGNPVHVAGMLYTTPEFLLVLANVLAFSLGMKGKVVMRLEKAERLSDSVTEYSFSSSMPLRFSAGQYLEWSLPHGKQDVRGIRRYFTIASAPGEPLVKMATRFSDGPSTFKKALKELPRGSVLHAGSLDGEFVLPKDASRKLVFIAGGIGITPFVSMVRDLMRRKQKADIVLFYANKDKDIAYMDLFKQAEREIGLKTVYVMDDASGMEHETAESGKLTPETLRRYVPDITERLFYLSGPNAMVDAYKAMVRAMGVKRWHIKTDYFPGL